MRVTIRTPASEGGRRRRTALGRRVTLAAALRLARNHTDRFSLEDSDTMAASALASSLTAVAAVRGRRVDAPRARRAASHRALAVSPRAMGPEMKSAIDKFVASNKIVVFMKGNKDAPRCGFSNTVVQIFKSMDVPFETVDILEDEGLRAGMKVYSDWPTFPQVYIDGEFYGGCDICVDTYKDGSLKETVDVAMMS